jgi:hypothetical protein
MSAGRVVAANFPVIFWNISGMVEKSTATAMGSSLGEMNEGCASSILWLTHKIKPDKHINDEFVCPVPSG